MLDRKTEKNIGIQLIFLFTCVLLTAITVSINYKDNAPIPTLSGPQVECREGQDGVVVRTPVKNWKYRGDEGWTFVTTDGFIYQTNLHCFVKDKYTP